MLTRHDDESTNLNKLDISTDKSDYFTIRVAIERCLPYKDRNKADRIEVSGPIYEIFGAGDLHVQHKELDGRRQLEFDTTSRFRNVNNQCLCLLCVFRLVEKSPRS